jgi:hypothetical protein
MSKTNDVAKKVRKRIYDPEHEPRWEMVMKVAFDNDGNITINGLPYDDLVEALVLAKQFLDESMRVEEERNKKD